MDVSRHYSCLDVVNSPRSGMGFVKAILHTQYSINVTKCYVECKVGGVWLQPARGIPYAHNVNRAVCLYRCTKNEMSKPLLFRENSYSDKVLDRSNTCTVNLPSCRQLHFRFRLVCEPRSGFSTHRVRFHPSDACHDSPSYLEPEKSTKLRIRGMLKRYSRSPETPFGICRTLSAICTHRSTTDGNGRICNKAPAQCSNRARKPALIWHKD